MSDFVNTIDLLGDDVVARQILDGSITELRDNVVTDLSDRALEYCDNLTTVDMPNLMYTGIRTFSNCLKLSTVNFPRLLYIGQYLFNNNTAIKKLVLPSAQSFAHAAFLDFKGVQIVDLHVAYSLGSQLFSNDSSLTCLILRIEKVCALNNIDAFNNTPIKNGTGYIYVPRALVDSYKTATNWSTYANQFRALEDYTVDGTTTGEIDESKI